MTISGNTSRSASPTQQQQQANTPPAIRSTVQNNIAQIQLPITLNTTNTDTITQQAEAWAFSAGQLYGQTFSTEKEALEKGFASFWDTFQKTQKNKPQNNIEPQPTESLQSTAKRTSVNAQGASAINELLENYNFDNTARIQNSIRNIFLRLKEKEKDPVIELQKLFSFKALNQLLMIKQNEHITFPIQTERRIYIQQAISTYAENPDNFEQQQQQQEDSKPATKKHKQPVALNEQLENYNFDNTAHIQNSIRNIFKKLKEKEKDPVIELQKLFSFKALNQLLMIKQNEHITFPIQTERTIYIQQAISTYAENPDNFEQQQRQQQEDSKPAAKKRKL